MGLFDRLFGRGKKKEEEEVKEEESKFEDVNTMKNADIRGNDLREIKIDFSELKIKQKEFYAPGNVLFELDLPREILKKQPKLKNC